MVGKMVTGAVGKERRFHEQIEARADRGAEKLKERFLGGGLEKGGKRRGAKESWNPVKLKEMEAWLQAMQDDPEQADAYFTTTQQPMSNARKSKNANARGEVPAGEEGYLHKRNKIFRTVHGEMAGWVSKMLRHAKKNKINVKWVASGSKQSTMAESTNSAFIDCSEFLHVWECAIKWAVVRYPSSGALNCHHSKPKFSSKTAQQEQLKNELDLLWGGLSDSISLLRYKQQIQATTHLEEDLRTFAECGALEPLYSTPDQAHAFEAGVWADQEAKGKGDEGGDGEDDESDGEEGEDDIFKEGYEGRRHGKEDEFTGKKTSAGEEDAFSHIVTGAAEEGGEEEDRDSGSGAEEPTATQAVQIAEKLLGRFIREENDYNVVSVL